MKKLIFVMFLLLGCEDYHGEDVDGGAQAAPDNYYNACVMVCHDVAGQVCFFPRGNQCGCYGMCNGAGECDEERPNYCDER